ncbi:hypothetical protein HMPREF9442_02802, partial [Paraprevotella xylaniphila YIT 11841]
MPSPAGSDREKRTPVSDACLGLETGARVCMFIGALPDDDFLPV